MSAEIPMPIMTAAVLTETADLSAEEFGAFQRLICHMWIRGGRLVNDPTVLARLAGVDQTQWARVWQAIGHLFDQTPQEVTRPALSEALAKAKALHLANQNRAAAMNAGRRSGGGNGSNGSGGGHPRKAARHEQRDDERDGHRDDVDDGRLTSDVTSLVTPSDGGFGGSVSDLLNSSSDPDPNPQIQKASLKHTRGPVADAASVRAVFDHYRGFHPQSFPHPQASSKEWTKIASRLREGHTVADLCRAIDGYHADPFHLGDNDRNTRYLGLELIMRTGTHVAQGLEYAAKGPALALTSRNRGTVRGVTLWLQRRAAERAAAEAEHG